MASPTHSSERALQAASLEHRFPRANSHWCRDIWHALDTATVAWVSDRSDGLRVKLADAGLVEARKRTTLTACVDDFIAANASRLSGRTGLNWKATRDKLVGYLGEDLEIRDITGTDACEWQAWLRQQKTKSSKTFAKATISRHTEKAKRFFNTAVSGRYIDR